MAKKPGRALGMPVHLTLVGDGKRRPSVERWKRRSWNAEDERVITPKSFGWGYGINFRSLWRRLSGR